MRTAEYIVLFSLGCLFFVLTDSLTSSILVVLCLVLSMIIRVCDEQRNLIANILAIGNLLWLFIAVGMSLFAYSAKPAQPFQWNGALFRFNLNVVQID